VFERYTEEARRSIFFARYEASQFGSSYIESEHLLLGLLRENKNLSYRFLGSTVSRQNIREQIEAHTTIREKISTTVDLPHSTECKRILAHGAEEADLFSHKFIGTEHLFLGILRESSCFAARLLHHRGLSMENARRQMEGRPPEELGLPPQSPGVPGGYTSHRLLFNPACEALIVELRRTGAADVLPTRIFMRPKNANAYEPIGNPTEDLWYESAVTWESKPIVMFNAVSRGKSL
jgi:ATP-dependent Clp protease ATP-binding subunit ClpC